MGIKKYCAIVLLLVSSFLTFFAQEGKIEEGLALDSSILKWEEDIRVFDSLNLAEKVRESSILFTGSSSIRRWDSISWDMAPYSIIKRGYGGAKLSDFSHYLPRIVKSGEYSAIVIFIANDISGREEDKTPGEVFYLFRKIAENLRASNPDSEIFWIEVTPTPSRWEVYPLVHEAGERIRMYCANTEKLHFIHTSPYLLSSNHQPDSSCFVSDMLHLNRKGYFLWSGIIKQALADAGINP